MSTEPNDTTPKATPPRRAILDFDVTVDAHEHDERGLTVPLADVDGEPWYNPDGTPSVLVFAGPTSERSRSAVGRNQIAEREQRAARPKGKDGRPLPLTKEEIAQQWETLLFEKYIATTIAVDAWRKVDGEYQRIPLVPDTLDAAGNVVVKGTVRRLFEANPHFADLCWLQEVRRSVTFRTRAQIADRPGEVARPDAAAGDETVDATDAGAPTEQPATVT